VIFKSAWPATSACPQTLFEVDMVHARISWQIPVDWFANCELYHCN